MILSSTPFGVTSGAFPATHETPRMLVRNSATTLVNIRRRARRLEAAGRLIEAEGEYRRLLQSASSVPGRGADRDRARMVRNASRMHWLGSRFDSAAFGFASLLKEARARGRPEDPMALVWRYLSLARLDPAAALAELRQRPPMAHAHRGSWAASILELFCGRMPPAEFSASVAALRARTSPRVTPHVAPHVANRQMGDLPRSARVAAAIENFYLGQWCLLHGHALAARMHLSAAAGLGGKFESCAAAVERQRLQAGHVAGTRA